MMLGRISMVAAAGLLLTACGTNVEQRAATGALSGAGIGALAGGPVGAAIGFGAGAVAGAAAPVGADQVAMWGLDKTDRFVASNSTVREMASEGTSRPPRAASAASSAGGAGGTQMVTVAAPPAGADWVPTPQAVRDAQQSLRAQGLYNGPADGILGPKTKTALSQYQQRNSLDQTARLDQDTLNRLRNDRSTGTARNQPGTAGQSGNPNATPANQGAAGDQSPPPAADQTTH
ncbi:MAG TPA: peptidoglycan-binding domain-containing protein [Stellaceae bacterium]|jgi:hypothetical protein